MEDEIRSRKIEKNYKEEKISGDNPNFSNSLSQDYSSIIILLILYTFQGIPIGLSSSIPLILQNLKVTYSQQAIFSLATWPFSLKLIWAPLVDSFYSKSFGRRKSWLIPSQYLIGFGLLFLSYIINDLLNPSSKTGVNVTLIAAIFFIINFFCATQDITVDGWALSMLSEKNVVYASTCNTVGQNIGYTIGFIVFLALESPEICNRFFRSTPKDTGLITLEGFLYFWAIILLLSTTLIMIFKKEDSEKDKMELGIIQTYKMLYNILRLKSIQTLVIILLTCKIAFGIIDSGTSLKLTEAGVSKEALAFVGAPILPLQIMLPWILSIYTKGPRPLDIFIKSYPYRLFCGLIYAFIFYWTKSVKEPDGSFPLYYYIIVIFTVAIHQVTVYCGFVSLMAFHAKISDPSIGGTYMTLLNTITNLGGNWPGFLCLWLIDYLTIKSCTVPGFKCNNAISSEECQKVGGVCKIDFDGFYIEVFVLIIFGFIWLRFATPYIRKLQSLPLVLWKYKLEQI